MKTLSEKLLNEASASEGHLWLDLRPTPPEQDNPGSLVARLPGSLVGLRVHTPDLAIPNSTMDPLEPHSLVAPTATHC